MAAPTMAAAGVNTLQGVVKSWNGAKGYGFINCEDFAGDIMFSRNELPEDAREVQGNFLQGKVVFFEALENPDGRAKATSVSLALVEGQGLVGKIKSFSERNGYGFITSSCLQTDVRFQTQDLPASTAPGTNVVGQLVTFHTQARPDGKLMVQKLMFQQAPGKINAGIVLGNGCGAFGNGCGAALGVVGPMFAKGGGKGCLTMAVAPMAAAVNPQVTGQTMTGTVKSYSSKNGYGFILVPGQQGDVKFGAADLSNPAAGIEPGTGVSFMAVAGPNGKLQAKSVQPAAGGLKRPSGAIMPTAIMPMMGVKRQNVGLAAVPGGCAGGAEGQWVTGTVKSFNSMKGFGFISSPEQPTDIYFSNQSLGAQAGQPITPGQAATCELNYAPDGKVRAKTAMIH
jgi:cold shock CspA family protein